MESPSPRQTPKPPPAASRARRSPAAAERARGRRGLALFAVLWGLTLLSVAAASFTTETRTEARLARNQAAGAEARALAEAGVQRAALALLARDPAKRWRADGTVHELRLGDGRVRVAVQDEVGKIDLNRAPAALLAGLFAALGAEHPEALADAVADFRDGDDLRRAQGAEDRDYRLAGLALEAKDGPFEAVEELGQVLGMTPALYARVAPFVTVHSGRHGIDPWVAPEAVLRALPGAKYEAVAAFLERRAAAPPPAASAAEGPSATPAPPPALGQAGTQYFTHSRQRVFTVVSEGRSADGTLFVREAVIELTGTAERPFRVYTWKQGRPLDSLTSDAGG